MAAFALNGAPVAGYPQNVVGNAGIELSGGKATGTSGVPRPVPSSEASKPSARREWVTKVSLSKSIRPLADEQAFRAVAMSMGPEVLLQPKAAGIRWPLRLPQDGWPQRRPRLASRLSAAPCFASRRGG